MLTIALWVVWALAWACGPAIVPTSEGYTYSKFQALSLVWDEGEPVPARQSVDWDVTDPKYDVALARMWRSYRSRDPPELAGGLKREQTRTN